MPTIHVRPESSSDLQTVADAFGKSRKVVVVTGAGISTNCGIPDFRSENGLYSLIQAQYDAAIQNPPWEQENTHDIDDRPKKRRKPWYFYEVVAPGGEVVDVIDDVSDSKSISARSSRSRSASVVKSRSTSPPPSSSENSELLDESPSLRECSGPSTDCDVVSRNTSQETPDSKRKSHRLQEVSPSTSSDILSSPPPTPLSQQSTSNFSVVVEVPPPTERLLDRLDSLKPPLPQSIRALQREESSILTSDSDDEPATQSSQSSRTSLPNLKGRDLFDSMIWSDPFTTSIFYMFITTLRQKISEVKETTEAHKFLRVLRDGGRLVRNYTQNIDCLEEREGLNTELLHGPGNRSRFHSKTQKEPRPSEILKESAHCGGVEVVLLHGSLNKLRCGICTKLSEWDEERSGVTLAGKAPDCPSCTEYNAKRTGKGRRGLAVGRLRPDIVLYGEEHPQNSLISPLVTHDLGLGPDVLLIMGTSLKVHGLKIMVKEFAKAVHTRGGKVIFINRTKPSESTWGDVIDYWIEWDCDAWVLDLKQRRGDIWLPQGASDEQKRQSIGISRPIKEAKPSNLPRKKKYEPPRCTRDDRINGVFLTFKILDSLRTVEDDKNPCTRPQYWEVKAPRVSNVNSTIAVIVESKPKKAPRKSEPVRKPRPQKADPTMNKRKSLPAIQSSTDGFKYNPQVVIDVTWQDLCRKYPSLNPNPPEVSPAILQERCRNIPKTEHTFLPFAAFNHAPFLTYGNMSLTSHPPSGVQIAKLAKPKPPPTNHAYGTRSSRHAVRESENHGCTLQVAIPPFKEDASARSSFSNSVEDRENRPPLTPPHSDPPSEGETRIKRLGSIGAILSPRDDESEEAYFSAQETPS